MSLIRLRLLMSLNEFMDSNLANRNFQTWHSIQSTPKQKCRTRNLYELRSSLSDAWSRVIDAKIRPTLFFALA